MMDDPLPPGDHVARFCDRRYISENDGVEPGAFMLRKVEEYLSVQWLEHLGKPSRREEISEVRKILSGHLKIRRPSKIAVLNVGKTCDHVAPVGIFTCCTNRNRMTAPIAAFSARIRTMS